MQLKKAKSRARGRRANVSVEFALILAFFLLPLFAGAADFITILNGQAQLNTALQALIYYAWTNYYGTTSTTGATAANISTTSGGEVTILGNINSASNFPITYSAVAFKSATITSSGNTYTVGTTTPAVTCTESATQLCYIQYTLSTHVKLPFPLPLKLTNPLPLSATGAAQIGSIH